MSGNEVTGAASKQRSVPPESSPKHRRRSIVPTYGPTASSKKPRGFLSSFKRRTAQKDVEMEPGVHLSYDRKDDREQDQHDIDDPFFIADYLAGNTSKAATVFRRYDRLVIYRLVSLSRDLNSLEEKHDEYVDKRGKGEWSSRELEYTHLSTDFSDKLKEYCRKLLHIRTDQANH